MSGNSFVVVANRLPVDLDSEGNWQPSPGGLVTALSPVLTEQQGCWVGWPGVPDQCPEPFHTDDGILLHPVQLTQQDYEEFYEGFSNATLWPLYHDLIVPPEFHRTWWETYREVNLKFAEAVSTVADQGATVWVQDYQLQLVPGILRQIRPDLTIGFFLHIPFPGAELFRQLPWREEIMRGLLGADLIGFHSIANAENFLALSRQIAGTAGSHIGQPDALEIAGTASIREVTATVQAPDGRTVGVAAFPISIDSRTVAAMAKQPTNLRGLLGDKTLILGVDRLDYTKGILQRLMAFEELLASGAVQPQDVVFVQIATPSRERIEHYKKTRTEVEAAVGRINGLYGEVGAPVVHYIHRSVPKDVLMGYYAAADVMLVTPFKDGMNLVAKEYVACHEDDGALVLSEFAGAAVELTDAYLTNPYDIESIKRQLLTAINDVSTGAPEARSRMEHLHDQVMEHDVHLWASSFLRSLEAKR
ncbi:trehalose-6-phosphate synthase [Corynebacterium hindlerae]|uniref:alpha,alpha-trehalose-phosphate synthase (UDP-forming) n=1 Tax=Corynebacterium hindlerae TaxID=699041 RepID=UPI001AD6BDB4|nr:trehalose-6-phosphate synthase [Corynebacterium hindlerae]QTH59485.1 trehalose-6-phosphate synthase [Corynebacterium hindlerae]